MLHYHGTPVTPREKLFELAGRNFCVSFAEPRDVGVCHEIGQSVMLDNGAYSIWRKVVEGKPVPERLVAAAKGDWSGWAEWAEEWLDYPTTWAVLPDSITGGEDENDRLLREYASVLGTPVWHLDEPLERLSRLVDDYGRVCFGSSGVYRSPGSPAWHRRVSEAFDALADEFGRVPYVHMLRGLRFAGSHYPFASADSVNAARNHAGSWRARPKAISQIVAEMDARQCPALWIHSADQLTILKEEIA